MTDERETNPKYVYDGLTRKNPLDKYEQVKAIDLPDHATTEKAYCPECHHSMTYDDMIEQYICNNDNCGVILQRGYKDAPLRDTDILHTANDPYGTANKPTLISINPVYEQEYEDFGNELYKSAEDAMKETRRKNNYKTKPFRVIKSK